jgi:hypothetical protein
MPPNAILQVGEAALFCLWLTPLEPTKMALLIEGLAAKHSTPPFPPHVTLATTPGQQNPETRSRALAWLRGVSRRSTGPFTVSLGAPEAGETRHQCVLSPIRQDGVGRPMQSADIRPSLHNVD